MTMAEIEIASEGKSEESICNNITTSVNNRCTGGSARGYYTSAAAGAPKWRSWL